MREIVFTGGVLRLKRKRRRQNEPEATGIRDRNQQVRFHQQGRPKPLRGAAVAKHRYQAAGTGAEIQRLSAQELRHRAHLRRQNAAAVGQAHHL